MAVQTRRAGADQALPPAQRRDLMQLPLEERRRRLAVQAEQMAEHYEQRSERLEREEWQGGDIVEPSSSPA